MGRRKATRQDERLTEIIHIRLTEATYKRLDAIRLSSDCATVGEVVRRIIEKERIVCFHKDASMDGPMEILTSIAKELKAIGININQVTRQLNGSVSDGQRWHHIKQATTYYREVDHKVSLVLTLISQLAKKWL